MKRHFGILTLIQLFTAAIFLTSCKGIDAPDKIGKIENQLIVVQNKTSPYIIVRPDEGSAAETEATIKLKAAISKVTGTELKITTDWDGKTDNSNRLEILIGNTNRIESAQAAKELTENQFVIKTMNSRIVITGGSSKALTDAVDYFLKEFLGYTSEKNYSAKTEFLINSQLNVLSVSDTSKKINLFITDETVGYTDAVKNGFLSAYTRITEYTCDDSLAEIFNRNNSDLVVIIGANKVPAGTISAVDSYMSKGGKVLTVGGPTFQNILYPLNGTWVTEQEYLISSAENNKTKKEIIKLSSEKEIRKLSRSTNDLSQSLVKETGDFGLEKTDGQLKVTISNLTSWDVLNTGFSVPAGNNAIGFWAKGDENTSGLYVEVFENDGSRWYAVAPLSPEWKYFILNTQDFTIYDSPKRAGTSLDISKGVNIQFGLAMSGQSVSSGEHTYYIADLCTLAYVSPDAKHDNGTVYSINGMTPEYELYPVTNAASVAAGSNQIFLSDLTYILPSDLFSCSPGRQATGYGKERTSRFIPLLEVFDTKGIRSGYAAWMYVFNNEDGAGNPIYTTFSVNHAAFYNTAGIQSVCDAAAAMLSGSFLVEGGTDEYIYISEDTDKITAGTAVVVELSNESVISVKLSLYDGDILLTEKTGIAGDSQLSQIKSDSSYKMEFEYNISAGLPDRAVTELYTDGVLTDKLEHEVSFWKAKPEENRKYIYTENGAFMRDGKILNLFGINYMPSSGVAEENGPLFEYYVSAASYDPDVFYNDLLRVKDIGFNCVSLFVYYDSMSNCNNILHLINMCEEMGLYVDLSIRPYAYPFNYNPDQVELMITRLHLSENDNIIAYDIAWEPMLGPYESERGILKSLDGDWKDWIQDQYGGITAAEKAWGTPAPRDDGENITGATGVMLDAEPGSQYDKIVAAYRRFIDDAVANKFNVTLQHMLSLDPRHLISFRMSMAGSPSVASSTFCYDFRSIASTMAFMSPEGYALTSSGDSAKQALFANVYARYTNPGKPVVWKEYGKHVWNGSNFNNNSGNLEAQKSYYEAVLAEFYKAYTSALYCWFFPGGYRCAENSDYGIINPDGSDRPVTETLRKYAKLFKAQGLRDESDYFIKTERDDYPNGITGMYDVIKDELIQAFDKGRSVSLANKLHSNGILYADECMDYAVGNAKANIYPLRYVNGQILKTGTVISNGQKYLRITVINTQDASWRAGTVSIISVSGVELEYTFDNDIAYLDIVTADIPVNGSGETVLKFNVNGVLFGMKFSVTIK
ncbi:MAG: hypothetical protein ACYCWE_11715 [Eubacteriales bacterium]